jgi:hypothetical protein
MQRGGVDNVIVNICTFNMENDKLEVWDVQVPTLHRCESPT